MKKLLSFALLGAAACGCLSLKKEPVKIIFDTDFYTDYDDVGALACLHALADAGEAEIVAMGSSTRGKGNAAVAGVEIVNAWYGRPDVPVGATRTGTVAGAGAAAFGLREKHPGKFKHALTDDAPDVVEVYRKALAAQPDKSVTFVTVGFLSCARELLESKPDAFSPLNGRDLVAKKVKLWVAMACCHPKGRECNSSGDGVASRIALDQWPTPIWFTDFQYGFTTFSGRAVSELPEKGNPVQEVFARMLTPRARCTDKSWDRIAGHPSWDETAVLMAVRGWRPYFGAERGRYRMVNDNGENEWVPDPESESLRIVETMPKAEVGKVLDELMCRPPKNPGW
ncbi:MAG: nucleoside hydrolase [Kiritimatiellae bacterium]|nr:nucleoside hydrolase [Kiritimatiellia bacterium]